MTSPKVAPSPGTLAADMHDVQQLLVQTEVYYRLAHNLAYESSSSRSELGMPITGGGAEYPIEDMLSDQRKSHMRAEMCNTSAYVKSVIEDLRERMVDLGLACGMRVKDWDQAEARASKSAKRRRGPKPKYSRNGRGT